MKKALVLGLGNILLRDEGAGVRVVERLQRLYQFPDDVGVLDGGTLGLDLLPCVEDTERLLIVDAVAAGEAPGAIVRLEGDRVPAFLSIKLSPHQVGVADLLAAARLRDCCPPELVLLGVQPEVVEVGLELSQTVDAQLQVLADRALAELDRWGIRFTRRLDQQEGR